ncbi:MAG: dephospho-CoA kinase, partial [Bdellovibrionota bacterium]
FAEPLARADLEKILHPLIVAESRKRLQAFGKPVVFYEATLLVETGRHQEFDGLLVIEAPMAIRRERLIRRDHSPAPLAEKILRSQATDEQRRAVATAVLVNDGSLEDLREKVRHFIRTQNLK